MPEVPTDRPVRRSFPAFRQILVPVLYGSEPETALRVARALTQDVILLGMVPLGQDDQLSAGASRAQELRRTLHQLVARGAGRARARVRVTSTPWSELRSALESEPPDLLLLEWPSQVEAMGAGLDRFLAESPCDTAMVRGPVAATLRRLLVPMRGGPHAELALRVALRLEPAEVVALHLSPSTGEGQDAPFLGMKRILPRLPLVALRTEATDDPSETILASSRDADLTIMGMTARPLDSPTGLGNVASQVLERSTTAVMAVKTRRPMPASPSDAAAGAQAISILVDKWFAENTFQADEFADLQRLVELKQKQGVTISLAMPSLNEEATVARVIRILRRALMDRAPLLDEIVLVDSRSTDRTRSIAARLGIPVFIHQELLPRLGEREGKGEALWKSLLVTRGDILAWVDTDIVNMHPRFIYGILGPLLQDPRIHFVKGFYRRPLKVGSKTQAGGGGRVTELTARPLLNLFYPELSGVIQPLSGEYAGRRSVLEELPFFSGYGVETGLLIDVFERYGLAAIAQVDLLERVHHNQPLEALSKMSFAIIQAVIQKLETRFGRALLEDVNKSMKLIRYQGGAYSLDVEELVEHDRPPMATIPEYRLSRPSAGGAAQ
ncbi:MAG TPA: glucosyl-3-phosphoglycerate synthase [Anaerolineales bacterium]|nr:glucosyl-3-phosphoglycerate synthase [Anaerolineales bacterium]